MTTPDCPNRGAEQRVSWRVSRSGATAACILVRPGTRPQLEIRRGRDRRVLDLPGLGISSQILLADDGTIMLCHHRDSRHLVDIVHESGDTTTVLVSQAQGLALVTTTLALEYDPAGFSRLLRFDAEGPVEIVRFAGPAVGAVPLDDDRIAVNVRTDGGCDAVLVDLAARTVEPYVTVSRRSDDQVVDYCPATGLLIIATDATGEVRLGVGRPGLEPVTFPSVLAGPGSVTQLATSADGDLIALSGERGACSEIRLVGLAGPDPHTPELPPLVVLGRGALTATELVVPVSCPDRPATLLHLDIRTGAATFDDPPLDDAVAARVGVLPGLPGVECLFLGDLVTSDTVVVALHGGPLSAWRAMYDPFLADLATAGVAVVAPNIRGSVGYGRSHWSAIIGDWGGPDLADVVAVGAIVAALRADDARLPVVLGNSYGAYLAMSAAQRSPCQWSACVALSPFVSGARLMDRPGPTAELVRRLGGDGSPDLRLHVAETSAPVLLIHGVEDDVIPLSEAALLHRSLLAAGRHSSFRPLPAAGHDLLTGPFRSTVTEAVVAFCRHPVDGQEITADDQPVTAHSIEVDREEELI